MNIKRYRNTLITAAVAALSQGQNTVNHVKEIAAGVKGVKVVNTAELMSNIQR